MKAQRKPVVVYDYCDRDGTLLYQNCRYEPKDFRQRRPDGNGGHIWNLDGINHILYRLPELRKAIEAGESIIFFCEGEKDVHNLEALDLVATTSGSATSWKSNFVAYLQGAKLVCVLPHNDEAGQGYAEQVATSCIAAHISVKVLKLPNLKPKGDISDWLDDGGTEDELLKLIADTPYLVPSHKETDESDAKKAVTQKQALTIVADRLELWHDEEGEPYATIPAPHMAHVKVRSRELKDWLCGNVFKQFQIAPSRDALDDVLRVISAKAQFDDKECKTHIRITGNLQTTYLHLADEAHTIFEIDACGVRITNTPLKFLKKRGMQALPTPKLSMDISEARRILKVELRKFLNLENKAEYLLFLTALLSGFRAQGPFVVVLVVGQQGSAKSTLCRIFRRLVDPNTAPLRSAPREERDLWIAARNGWLVMFDNVSKLLNDLSDQLCRLTYGGGNSYRTLYENDDETLFQTQRLVLLNTIDDLQLRGDLVDRSIRLSCKKIESYLSEQAFWPAFEEKVPDFLGALLMVLSETLKKLPNIEAVSDLRMADFARFGIAVEAALAETAGSFLKAYRTNRVATAEIALEDQFAELILGLALPVEESATNVLAKLKTNSGYEEKSLPHWFPKNGQALSSKLRRLAPLLRFRGIEIEFPETRPRKIIIRNAPADKGKDASNASAATEALSSDGFSLDTTAAQCDGNASNLQGKLDLSFNATDGTDATKPTCVGKETSWNFFD